ncbi:MAG: DEAD/DEAH box helicase [Thermoplasmata archaeon]|nr:DEAD/DEAH box helicase [Thermoplasmata archaeon]
MRVDELDIPDSVAEALVSAGFRELHPPQAEAIPVALEGRNLVAAIPTASGKSLIGMVPALKLLAERGGKVLYIVPLKALASEKADDFRRFSETLGFRVHMSTGDLDGEDRGLSDADVVVATSEKTDSMIRHGSRWMDGVKLVIADEIHMIHDPGRGPTLEVALTKMMRKNRGMQVIALSATISNADDLADWLDARLVKSDWRPVPLHEGVYLDGEIVFDDGRRVEVPMKGDEIESLVRQTVSNGGQCLVFVNSRRSTEAVASRIAGVLGEAPGISPAEKSILEGDSEATDMGRRLASCVSKGVAFHNAGLTYRQRRVVEDGFKSGTVKCIVATPTLAAGINLPARRVVVRDTTRFEKGGNVPIAVMEVKQMCGRAGRPGYDPYGEAILMARSQRDADHLMEDYVEHDTERVTSKLFSGNVVRSHILGVLATGDADSEESIVDFMRGTFYGATSQMFGIESVVSDVVDFLAEKEMVERVGDRIEILPFGRRVSDLYIDPMSASILRDAVMRIDSETDDVPILIAAAMTPDVLGMYPKKGDTERLRIADEMYGESLLVDPDDTEGYMPELFDSDLKVALLVKDWIDEVPEEMITDGMGIGPGDIRSKVDMMDWIVYAMGEVAYIFNPPAVRRIKPLTVRIRYGVKEELTDLVSLRGVGRSRARALFKAGFRTRADVSSADAGSLTLVVGPALAASILRQSGGSRSEEPYASPSEEEESLMDEMAAAYGEVPAEPDKKGKGEAGPKQASLFDFRGLTRRGCAPRRRRSCRTLWAGRSCL